MAGETRVGNLAVVLSANADPMAAEFRRAAAEVQTAAADIQAKAGRFGPAGRAAGGNLSAGFREAVAESGGGAAGMLGRLAGPAAVGATMLKLGGEAFDLFRRGLAVNADREAVGLSFDLLLGDTQQAERLMGRIRQHAADTGQSFQDVAETTKVLMGRAPVGTEKAFRLAQALRNVTIATGGDMQGLAKAMGDVLSKGQLMAEELKGQFGDQGFPIHEVAKTMGVSMRELNRRMSLGQVGDDVMVRTVERLGGPGGKWGDADARYAQTAAGRQKKAEAARDEAAADAGKAAGPLSAWWTQWKTERWKDMSAVFEHGRENKADMLWAVVAKDGETRNRFSKPVTMSESFGFHTARPTDNPFTSAKAADQLGRYRAERIAGGAKWVETGFNLGDAMQEWKVNFKDIAKDVAAAGRGAWEGFFRPSERKFDAIHQRIGELSQRPGAGSPMDVYRDQMGRLAGLSKRLDGGLNREGVERFKLEQFAQLEAGVGAVRTPQYSPALQGGTQAAESVISAAMREGVSREEEVKAIMERANQQRERMMQMQRDTLRALEKLEPPEAVDF